MAAERKPRSERTLERVRRRKERHKRRNRAYRVVFAILGTLLIVAGLLLSAPGIPGPGLIVIAIGLGMLALEFDRAERLLEQILKRVDALGDQASQAPPWQRGLLGAAIVLGALGAVGIVLLWEVPVLPG